MFLISLSNEGLCNSPSVKNNQVSGKHNITPGDRINPRDIAQHFLLKNII